MHNRINKELTSFLLKAKSYCMTLPVKECLLKAASWEPSPGPKTGLSSKFSLAMCRLLYKTNIDLLVLK